MVALIADFPESSTKIIELPYLRGLPDEVSFYPDGKTLLHERFGEGTILSYMVVFKKLIMKLSYPSAFIDGMMSVK